MKTNILSSEEVKLFLKLNGYRQEKKYHHEDYMYTSFTMPYEYKRKIDRLAKKYDMTRSAFFRLMLDSVSEDV